MGKDETNLYNAGTEISTDKADSNYTVKLTAKYEIPSDVKYAVSIYGIKQDSVEDPNQVAALTFGPATGEDYTYSFKSCDSPNCIHKLTWDQIIQKANQDPSIFESCLENGCTKSVAINISDAMYGEDFGDTGSSITGDGISAIHWVIYNQYRNWNFLNDNTGGWPASRIRTTLNGTENCKETDTYVAAPFTGSDLLSQADALISAFPKNLQEAIIPKAVKSDVKYDSNDPEYNKTTYDKLWLFSIQELSTDRTFRYQEGLEGNTCYRRAEIFSSYGPGWRSAICELSHIGWETRSLDETNNRAVYAYGDTFDDSGIIKSHSLNNPEIGIAPGFCIGLVSKN